jgi:hypothetical protein
MRAWANRKRAAFRPDEKRGYEPLRVEALPAEQVRYDVTLEALAEHGGRL